MDYEKIKREATNRKQELTKRQAQITKEKTDLDDESEKLRLELIGLDELLESIEFIQNPEIPPDLEPLGFTEQVGSIFQGTTEALTPVEVRDLLLAKGVTGSSKKNLLIGVYTVIARHKDNLEATTKNGKRAYTWKGVRRFPRTRADRMRNFVGASTRSIVNTSNEMLAAQAIPQKVIEGK